MMRAAGEKEDGQSPPQTAPAAAQYRILLVGGADDARARYKQLLRRRADAAFDIYEAETARDGLGMCAGAAPDCILIDDALPGNALSGADGPAFIRACREKGVTAAIVMATDKDTEAAGALQAGAHDCMAKSTIVEGDFARRLLNAVARARMEEQVKACRRELEKANEALADFTHTASHDLKAPLNRIARYCDFLREEGAGALSADCLGYIDRMQANGRRMMRLIDDLRAYSHALHPGEARAPADLGQIAAGAVDDLEPLITPSGAAVTVGILPVAPVYPLRLRQMLQNLIGNALKYKSERAPVIAVDCIDAGTHYMISVRDNGMGIAAEHLGRIFRPFERLHRQEEIEGSGLGLAACRKIAEMHQGKIWAESEPGQGSVFCFTLPKEGK